MIQALSEHEIAVFHRGAACTPPATERHFHGQRHELASFREALRRLQPDVVLDMRPQNAGDAQHLVENLAGIAGRAVAVSSGSVYRTFGVLMGIEDAEIDNLPAREDGALRHRLFPYRTSTRRPADDPRHWLDDYDKIPAERVFLATPDLPCNIVRLPMVYGPGDPDGRIAPYLRRMIDGRRMILLQERIALWRNSRAYVDNVAAAIARVVLAGVPGRVYNVSEPEDFTEAEWIQGIAGHVGWRGTIVQVPDGSPVGRLGFDEFSSSANFTQHLRLDSSRIRGELGYREIVPARDALRRTVDAAMHALPALDYGAEDRFMAANGL